jgi:hypothetical protein
VRRPLATIAATVLAVCGVGATTIAGAASADQIGVSSADQISVGFFGRGTASFTQIPARIQGQLAVAFHGDRAAGCAARGVCGYSGTVVWQPPRTGSLEIVTYHQRGKLEHEASLNLIDESGPGPFPGAAGVASADVSSQPTGPGGSSSACTDAGSTGQNVNLPVRGQAVLFALGHAGPGLTETRCAAPLVGDFAHALVSRSLNLRAVSRGHVTISLASSGPFAGGGFAGTVSSTVRLSLGRPSTQRPTPSGRPKGPTVRIRSVDVRYRATIAGRLPAEVRGDPSSCSLLGSCGANGSFELRPRAMSGVLDVSAFTRARRPLRDVLTALGLRTGGNPRGISTFGSALLNGPGSFDADFAQGAVTCHDSVPTGPAAVTLQIEGRSLAATFAPTGGAMHTRCPGPLIDQSTALASGSVPVRLLGRRTATIPLTTGVDLLDDGYHGRTVPNLTLTITRTRIKTTFQSLPVG